MVTYINAIKNSKAFCQLSAEINANALSHAYMFISEDNVSLNSLIKLFCLKVFCSDICLTCKTCTQILSDNFLDLFWINENNSSIGVKVVEKLQFMASLSSDLGKKKLFVIENAQNITVQAQNKLLKILEEPYDDVIVIFGVNNDNTLLSTIKSRCKKVFLELFDENVIASELIGNYSSEQKMEASSGAQGLIISAQKLLDNKLITQVINMLVDLKTSKDVVKCLNSKLFNNDNFLLTLDILDTIFYDIINNSFQLYDKLLLKNHTQKIVELCKTYSYASAVNIVEDINKTRQKKHFNTNLQGLVESLLFKILEDRYICRI